MAQDVGSAGTELFDLLLSQPVNGVDIDCEERGISAFTSLMCCCNDSLPEETRKLIQVGADPNIQPY